MSERKAIEGGFVREVRELFAGDACFDDPCSFSVMFRPCLSRLLAGQKRGHMTVAVVVCFVEKSLQPWSTKLRRRDGNVEEVRFMLSSWFLVLCS